MIRIAAFALFGIFVVLDWDASNWPAEGRAVAAFTGFLAIAGATFR